MTANAWLQTAIYLGALVLVAIPLGVYMAGVFEGRYGRVGRFLAPLERLLHRLARVDPTMGMSCKQYALAFLAFHGLGLVVLYALLRVQHLLPLNPEHLGPVSWHSSFDTAVSFVTNTNWQGYGGETTMSYLVQMLGLTTQNFVSAASGIAVAVLLARCFVRESTEVVGNFWVDLVRATVHVLLPLSVVLALVLVSQGVVQTFAPYAHARLLDPIAASEGGAETTEQVIALGPAASQVAIKQLGTNGGGFFNANSAHPLENPTALSNFLQVLAILWIPVALCFTFGRLVGDRRQGIAVFAAMLVLFLPFLVMAQATEQAGNPLFAELGVDDSASELQSGGNMEGKEVRFGIASSGIWAAATTAASNGSVNSMHDSYTPLGGLAPLFLMQLGEVVFGGVGSGLYGLLVFAIIAVFLAGLMVGRTPEYLGKKLEAFEMKMASIAILAPCAAVLIGTALAVALPAGRATIYNPGAHGFSEVLYAFSSAGNNNGSAFAGLGANVPFYNVALGLAMLVGRFGVALPVIAIAGSLARKKTVPASAGTLPTHGALFVVLLIGTVLLVGALTFVPSLALGPIVEHLQMSS